MLSLSLATPALAMRASPPTMIDVRAPSSSSPLPDMRTIGDYGFDPLNLGTDETFVPFREAEVKHGRLAMLAAVAWPLQEIVHPLLVRTLNEIGVSGARDAMAETSGFSPSLLNGGLTQLEVAPMLMLGIFMASVLELQDIKTRGAKGLQFNEYDKVSL